MVFCQNTMFGNIKSKKAASLMRDGPIYNKVYSLFYHDGLILRNECLHDAPADEISHGTDAEHYHIGCGLAFETEEGEVGTLSCCPVEELTRTKVD